MTTLTVPTHPIPAGELRFRQHLASAQFQGGAAIQVSLDPGGMALLFDLDDGESIEIRVDDLVRALVDGQAPPEEADGPSFPIKLRVIDGGGDHREFWSLEAFEEAVANGWIRSCEIDGADVTDALGRSWTIAASGWVFLPAEAGE